MAFCCEGELRRCSCGRGGEGGGASGCVDVPKKGSLANNSHSSIDKEGQHVVEDDLTSQRPNEELPGYWIQWGHEAPQEVNADSQLA